MPPLMGLPVAFGAIAAFAGGQDIGPHMLTAFRDGAHMIGGEFVILKALAAIGTEASVPANEFAAR